MATYHGFCRSNYFKVKDEETFRKWISDFKSVDCESKEQDGEQAFVLNYNICGGWRNSLAHDVNKERYLEDEISNYLADGETVIFMESGRESVRYVTGNSLAINSTGDCVGICLEEIYELAEQKFGKGISKCEF